MLVVADPPPPDVGTLWIHRLGGRICKVVGVRSIQEQDGIHFLVEFQYRRTAGHPTTGGLRHKRHPTQTMQFAQWRGLFTKRAE